MENSHAELFSGHRPTYGANCRDGFFPPKDPQNPTLEEEKNLSLDTLATNAFFLLVSLVVIRSIMPLRNAHDLWTKLQDKYGVTNIVEDDCSPSTSGRDELSTSSIPPTCRSEERRVGKECRL